MTVLSLKERLEDMPNHATVTVLFGGEAIPVYRVMEYSRKDGHPVVLLVPGTPDMRA